MEHQIKLSLVLEEVEPQNGFCGRILARIERARRRSAQLRCAATTLTAFFSGALLVPLFQYAAREFYTSGFYDYAALFFSDHSTVTLSWREFLMTLLESLPSIALLFLLVAIGALLWFTRSAIKNGRVAFTPLRHTLA